MRKWIFVVLGVLAVLLVIDVFILPNLPKGEAPASPTATAVSTQVNTPRPTLSDTETAATPEVSSISTGSETPASAGATSQPEVTLPPPPAEPTAAQPQPPAGLPSIVPSVVPPANKSVDPNLEAALQQKLTAYESKLPGGLEAYGYTSDDAIVSSDGTVALLFMAPYDRSNGEIHETEPSLSVALKDDTAPNGWQVILPLDPGFEEALARFPKKEIPESYIPFVDPNLGGPKAVLDGAVYRGYYLPWPGGMEIRLTGSIGHFLSYKSCGETSCRYAYDFSNRTMFPLQAAKGGSVWLANWTCPNGATTCNNYLVIRDDTTQPVTFQLYLHMAYNTLPEELRKRGAMVSQGQFIGNADDTGASTGHHLHFMVHTNPNYWWGNSVDVRFQDVPINDGVPRMCFEAKYWPGYGATDCIVGEWYTSGNRDGTGPFLSISPLAATTYSTVVGLTYGGYDPLSGLKAMQLKVTDNAGNTAVLASNQPAGYYTYYFLGAPGQTYKFTVDAVDNLNNSSTLSASTSIAATCQPDQYESGDNQPTGSSYLSMFGATDHNFCGLTDPDWVRMDMLAGKEYFIVSRSMSGGAAMNLQLWSQESKIVASSSSAGLGQSTGFRYTPPTSGSYYLRVLPLDARLVGTDMQYQITLTEPKNTFLPIIANGQ